MSIFPTLSRPQDVQALVPPGRWSVAPESIVGFSVRSLGRTVRGSFGSFSGHLIHRRDDGVMASGSVDVASIDTGNAQRDEHLRSADFFDAANHPLIAFESRRIIPDGERFDIPGTLTIRGVSHDVSLIGRRLAPETGDGSGTVRISAEATIDRHAYGVRAPAGIELFGLLVAAHVKITLLLVAVLDDVGEAD